MLSALADVGIDQSISVTGSVNQLGEMQAIGGVCAKIEGFFDLCNARGLTGSQGVMIPKANLPHLVLREDVAQTIGADSFICTRSRRWQTESRSSPDRPLVIETAPVASAASVFGRVERRIIEIAERLRQAEAHGYDGGIEGMEDGGAEISEGGEFRRLHARACPSPLVANAASQDALVAATLAPAASWRRPLLCR